MTTYAFDPTGLALQNKVIGETKSLNLPVGHNYLFIIPDYAPFFEDTLVVKHTALNGASRILVPQTDYTCGFQYVDATHKTNRAVYSAINLTDITLTGTLTYNYQTLGGTYVLSSAVITSLQANEIRDPAFTALETITSMQELPTVDYPWSTVNVPDVKRVTEQLDAVGLAVQLRAKVLSSPGNSVFIPTPSEIGLGNLDNYSTATDVEAIAGTATDKFMTPAATKIAISPAVQNELSLIGYKVPVTYAAGLLINDKLNTYSYLGNVYSPREQYLPFTTNGSFEYTKFVMINSNVKQTWRKARIVITGNESINASGFTILDTGLVFDSKINSKVIINNVSELVYKVDYHVSGTTLLLDYPVVATDVVEFFAKSANSRIPDDMNFYQSIVVTNSNTSFALNATSLTNDDLIVTLNDFFTLSENIDYTIINGTLTIIYPLALQDIIEIESIDSLPELGKQTLKDLIKNPPDVSDVVRLPRLATTEGDSLVGSDDGATGTLWQTVKGFIGYLRSSLGSTILGHDSTTVAAVLNEARPLLDYAALRAYTGNATGVKITADGIAGVFKRSLTDVTSADNGGTIIVDVANRRWVRIFTGAINVSWFGAKGDGVTDDTVSIQAAINYASSIVNSISGNIVSFDNLVYIANLTMKSRVYLKGKGINTTVIKSIANTSLPVLNIPTDVAFIGWDSMTFDGNKNNSSTGSGIVFIDVNAGYDTPRNLSNKTITGITPYKYCNAFNFAVTQCGGDGIQIGQATFGLFAIFLNSFHCTANKGNGIVNWSTDNIISNFYCEDCGKNGLLNSGPNMKFIGGKLIFCGNGTNNTYAGLCNTASRCDFISIECQDNYCDGVQLSGDDNNYDLLLDANGYSTNSTTSSSRVNFAIKVLSGHRNKLKARVTNYRGILADGFSATEYLYTIAQGADFTVFDVSAAYTSSNSGIYLDTVQSNNNSDLILCKRNASTTINGISVTADQPSLQAGIGLYIKGSVATETVEVASELPAGLNSISYVIEFQYDATANSAPRIVKSEDGTFAVYLVPGSNFFEIDLPVNGVANVVTISVLPAYIAAGNIFRIAGNATIIGTNLHREDVVMYLTPAGRYARIGTNSTNVTLAGAYKFSKIRNPIFGEAGQTWDGIVKYFSVWSSTSKNTVDLYRRPGEGANDYDNGGIFVNFVSYASNTKAARVRSVLPAAGSFYRGKTFITEGGAGVADTASVCVKNAADAYIWTTLI